jgi:peptide/nickel transport system substrate-binding protein
MMVYALIGSPSPACGRGQGEGFLTGIVRRIVRRNEKPNTPSPHSLPFHGRGNRLALVLLSCLFFVSSEADAKTLRVGIMGWPPAMGNPYAQQIQGAAHPFPGLFDALTFMDTNGATLPNLALSWTNDGANTWTFKLRPNVTFINGEPFDSKSVAAMIEALQQPDAQRFIYASEVKNIATVNAPDALTVVFTTRQPDVILPKRLSLLQLVPPKLWRDLGPDAFAQKPQGTGAFGIESWGREKGYFALDAKAGAWRPARHLKRIEYRVLPDQAARTQALSTGQLDIAYNIGFEDFDDLKAKGFEVIVKAIATTTSIALSNINKNSALADKRVRQAMNYAVNRDAIAAAIMRGTVKPTVHGIEPGVFGYNPAIAAYPYDPAKARALLAEAGYAKGLKLKASVLTQGTPDMATVYQQVAQDLAAVGIGMELNSVMGPDWVQMWSSSDWRGADVLSSSWNGATYMDAGRAVEAYTCARPMPFFCASEVEALYAQSNVEFNEAKRAAQLQQALALLHDLAPAIYLFPQTEIMAISPKVKNLVMRGRYVDWTQVDMAP